VKYIITEDQYNSIVVKRRLNQIRQLVKSQFFYQYPCDAPDFETFIYFLIRETKDTLTLDWINDENFEYVEKFINTEMKDELRDYYVENCRNFD
jgi:hypothetical protein